MSGLDERIIASRIDRRQAGKNVLDYLSSRFTYRDRDGWRRRIAAGEIRLNGRPAGPDVFLAAGDLLSYHPGELPEPPADLHYRIAYEDEHLLIPDKPGNLPVHPAGPFYRNTLWFLLKKRYGEVFPVNRLDRETSGLLLFARTAEMARQLSRTEIRKRYLALVFGRFTEPVDADGFLVPDRASPVRKKRKFVRQTDEPDAQTAATRLEPVANNGLFSLVRAIPGTGRLHQIRATLCSLGYPLLGDKLYGPDETLYLKIRDDRLTGADYRALVLPRQALHSAAISFRHPATGLELQLESPLPEDWAAVSLPGL